MAKATTKTKDPLAELKPAELRFLTLYMGMEDGKAFNNATLAYLIAHDKWTPTVMQKQKDGSYSKEYLNAKQLGYRTLTKVHIQKARTHILLEIGFKPETIKARYAELMTQSRNLPLALTATDRVAKIAGLITDDKKVDIPQLTELGNAIRELLTPASKK